MTGSELLGNYLRVSRDNGGGECQIKVGGGGALQWPFMTIFTNEN